MTEMTTCAHCGQPCDLAGHYDPEAKRFTCEAPAYSPQMVEAARVGGAAMRKLLASAEASKLDAEFMGMTMPAKLMGFPVVVDKCEDLERAPVTTISRLELKPGDVLVIRYPGSLSQKARDMIAAQMNHLFPGRRCIILDEGMELQVVSPDAIVEGK